MKTALITGVGGQDGSYLAEFLLGMDYCVEGLIRQSSLVNTQRLGKVVGHKDFILHIGDVSDTASISSLVQKVRPDEIYHLAAQSHVAHSFKTPETTVLVDGVATVKLLEEARQLASDKEVRFYQASTSELFGDAIVSPQTEDTPFQPQSPYAIAKLYAYWMVRNYREAYDMFACNGILFNHESPRRGRHFVTRKITLALAKIKHGYQSTLRLGNLDASRDWGFAGEYVEAIWRILQAERAEDFIIATGESHTVREFVLAACEALELAVECEGSGEDEKFRCAKTGKVLVEVDPEFYRPVEVTALCGDATKARRLLGWQAKTTFAQLVEMMAKTDEELIVAQKGKIDF